MTKLKSLKVLIIDRSVKFSNQLRLFTYNVALINICKTWQLKCLTWNCWCIPLTLVGLFLIPTLNQRPRLLSIKILQPQPQARPGVSCQVQFYMIFKAFKRPHEMWFWSMPHKYMEQNNVRKLGWIQRSVPHSFICYFWQEMEFV